MADVVSLVAMTGWLENARPQSLLMIADAGTGKSELLERFRKNTWLERVSDTTVRGLQMVLRQAEKGATTHIVADELQRWFLRKSATAESTLGTLSQAMEEGVGMTLVGGVKIDFGKARLGLIGAITPEGFIRQRPKLAETGFLSRAAVFPWSVPQSELNGVLSRIGRQDTTDLSPIILPKPAKRVTVEFPVVLSDQFQSWVTERFRKHALIRVFNRFRALCMAAALLEGRDIVHAYDVERIALHEDYWINMDPGGG